MKPIRWLVLALALAAACGDPSAVVEPAPLRRLSLFMILDPGTGSQVMAVYGAQGEVVGQASLELLIGGEQVSVTAVSGPDPRPCQARYGTPAGAPPACIVFSRPIQLMGPFTIRVSAEGYPTATASVEVPESFSIVSATAAGSPPGTAGLTAVWTRSMNVGQYVVAIRSDSLRACWIRGACVDGEWNRRGWMRTATRDTTMSAVVPADALRGGGGGWRLEVYAMDQALFDYLTTGSGTEPFPVPPAQNVRNGYGVVGSWVRRSVPLP